MLSPLKPLLCRHEFYWSERHRSDLCRRCGKTRAAEVAPAAVSMSDALLDAFPTPELQPAERSFATADPEAGGPIESAFFDIPPVDQVQPAQVPVRRVPGSATLRAQAIERRENLLALLDRIAEGGQPSRRESLDVILAVIEDAHSADPVLFGADAAGHFAKLHEARSGLIF